MGESVAARGFVVLRLEEFVEVAGVGEAAVHHDIEDVVVAHAQLPGGIFHARFVNQLARSLSQMFSTRAGNMLGRAATGAGEGGWTFAEHAGVVERGEPVLEPARDVARVGGRWQCAEKQIEQETVQEKEVVGARRQPMGLLFKFIQFRGRYYGSVRGA